MIDYNKVKKEVKEVASNENVKLTDKDVEDISTEIFDHMHNEFDFSIMNFLSNLKK